MAFTKPTFNGVKWKSIAPLFWILLWLFLQNIEISQKNLKKRQNECENNTAKLSSQIVRAQWPQLTPFQNILEMDLPMAIFSEETADCNILHLYHVSKAKSHYISQFGTYKMLISWFAHHTWDQILANENLQFAIEYWATEVKENYLFLEAKMLIKMSSFSSKWILNVIYRTC